MALGPGKYDDLTTLVKARAGSPQGVLVMVVGGPHGSGFSVQATAEVTMQLPSLLRAIADSIEADLGLKGNKL